MDSSPNVTGLGKKLKGIAEQEEGIIERGDLRKRGEGGTFKSF